MLVLAFADITKTHTFRERIRARDQRCVISFTDTSLFQFIGLETAHIIPRSHSRYVINNHSSAILTQVVDFKSII
jgi:hypothetical protein